MSAVTLPPGKYYIGDLCYVMDKQWNEVHNLRFPNNNAIDGVFVLSDGSVFACYSTLNGDGSYPCSDGSSIGVDSGSIGCIKIDGLSKRDLKYGTIVEFKNNFTTDEHEGVIRFGHITIDTHVEDEDEDWERFDI